MKIKVTTPFRDTKEDRLRRVGEILTVTDDRGRLITAKGLGEEIPGTRDFAQYPAPTDKKFIALIRRLKKLGFIHGPHFHHFARGNMLLDILGGDRPPSKCDPAMLESFDVVTYKGREYNVPHPIEDYLRTRYGKTWNERRIRKPR